MLSRGIAWSPYITPYFLKASITTDPNGARAFLGSMARGKLLHHAGTAALAQWPGANPKALLNWRVMWL